MAQLPPKAPTMTQNWPDFPHQKTPMEAPNAPSWVDDFLDFSSTRRGSHRRSISDSIAFLEPPMVEECRRSNVNMNGGEFERFDDEQLMSMFTDDVAMGGPTLSCSNPSSPSDHYSMNDDDKLGPSEHFRGLQLQPKSEPDQEVQSSCNSEGQNSQQSLQDQINSSEKIVDPKRIKRYLYTYFLEDPYYPTFILIEF